MLRLLAGSLLLTLVVFIATVHGQDADEVAVRKVIKTIEKGRGCGPRAGGGLALPSRR